MVKIYRNSLRYIHKSTLFRLVKMLVSQCVPKKIKTYRKQFSPSITLFNRASEKVNLKS